jgi:transcriptional regulator with XRE-family HTH domain
MEASTRRTFKRALKSIRQSKEISLLDLGLRIESDASHIHKIESGKDVTLSTVLRLAGALGVSVQFGPFKLIPDPSQKRRSRKK